MTMSEIDQVPLVAPAPRQVRPAALGWLFLAPPLLFLFAFFFLPMLSMVAESLTVNGDSGLTFANYATFFSKPVLWGALVNSLELIGLAVLVTLPLAYALAAAVTFGVPDRWQATALALIILPFFTSYVVRTYAWLLVLSDTGLVNQAWMSLRIADTPLRLVNSRAGVTVVFVHYFIMFMTLSIYLSLKRIPQSIIKAARDLGASGPAVFRHIVMPLSLPGVAVGIFLSAVLGVGDYLTPQIIGGGRELTLPQAVMLQLGRFANAPLAAALSFVLTMIVLLALLAFSPWLRTRKQGA